MGNFASKNTQLDVTSGAAHARSLTGTGLLSKDRELNHVSTVQRAEWTASENITSVTVTVFAGAGTIAADTIFNGAAIAFNAPNTTVESTWLLEGSGMRKVVLIGHPRTFDVSDGSITKLSAIELTDNSTGDVHILVEAN